MSPGEAPNLSSRPIGISSQGQQDASKSQDLPQNLSFGAKIQETLTQRNLLAVSASSFIVTVVGYHQENYPLAVAGLTVCAVALGQAASLHRQETAAPPPEPPFSLQEQLEAIKKIYNYKNFRELSADFEKDMENILVKATQELSAALPNEMNKLVSDLKQFAADQLLDASHSENAYNSTMQLLTNVITCRISDITSNLREVQANINQDKQEIQQFFFPDYQGKLEDFNVEFPIGETHNKGKSVCFVTFHTHPPLKVVYKPRSLEIDALHADKNNGLFKILNTFAGKELLPTHRILNKNTHGYTEFLSSTSQDQTLTLIEMINYYHIIGRTQAFAQVFGLRDLHRDNTLVHQQKPFLIDLEVAFNIDALSGTHPTELYSAVIYNTESTQNIVALNIDGQVVFMEEHFHKFNQLYEECIHAGFEEMKNLIGQYKEELKKFVDNLPDDLLVRYVPVSTSSLKIIIGMNQLTEQANDLAFVLNQGLKKQHIKMLKEVDQETTKPDIMHHDVPILYQGLGGDYHYQHELIAQDQNSSKPLIKAMIDNIDTLKIETTFLEIIRSRRGKKQ